MIRKLLTAAMFLGFAAAAFAAEVTYTLPTPGVV